MTRNHSERAIILAPRGRDAALAATMLRDGGIESLIVAGIGELVQAARDGAGFALVTYEAFHRVDLRSLNRFIVEQEEWSDFPFILLTERGGSIERNPGAARHLELLGNVTLLERPFHPTTLISIATAALRGRRRQYEARARLQTIWDREQQLRIALSAGRLGAWTLDISTMTLDASDHCKANFGRLSDQPFRYEDLVSSVHPDDLGAMQEAVGRTLDTGVDYDVEYRCIWPDGSQHWVQVRGRLEDDGAKRRRLVGVSQDITERKASEETLRNFAAELEKRVEQRTREHEAMTAQLHEAQKLETLGQLTGGVAHDFNNLLTPIVGTLDMVRRKTDDPRTQKLLDGALQASERARTLVARLLAFARRQNLEAQPVDVTALVDGMTDLIQRSIGPTISLDVRIDEAPTVALVDPNQLELALLNLAVNARDAMPEGGKLTIQTSLVDVGPDRGGLAPGPYTLICVADTGSGMDAATLARAVEPFYSTKGVGKGTGLGLSMVHGLAAQSGGTLVLESEPGSGTTVKLWLPAASLEAVTASVPSEDWQSHGQKLRILLVDDEELVRAGTAEMLADMGHEIVQAGSGATALAVLRSRPFDILVTDYLMPSMSGLELAREARKLRSDLPVLLITGFADLADDRATDVARLAKPFQMDELARSIEAEVAALTRTLSP
ncbi:response regulator [Sphingomonas sp. CGMCC 1.13654]|uniref:histidine kinase n=1 Tax=Sphingomonas chungangi TaxID=2683589 RepID=A0A838L4Z2_9SPHN|nr:hybrid sensor histidine kinase/response regulator [Sphingomonas chungangi]MBA2934441.1 response regulator [Sphingomonas chungangi]MVW57480.1 response regulator [Sphingomonas chungangi]